MTERRIRLSVPLTGARIGAHHCLVANISLSGALLMVDFEPVVGSTWKVTLQARKKELDLLAQIVRIMPVNGPAPPGFEWQTGVMWLNLTTEKRGAIAMFYTLMAS
jgi:hypothetical protein